jgi:hypothetical protein
MALHFSAVRRRGVYSSGEHILMLRWNLVRHK